MPGQGREIRRRLKSIKSTRQITRAMELVSAAKMRRAVANVLATRPYAALAWDVVQEIARKIGSYQHPLFTNSIRHSGAKQSGAIESPGDPIGRPDGDLDSLQDDNEEEGTLGRSDKIALVLITSNRGLAGSLNANIIQKAQAYIAEQLQEGLSVDLVVMGRKGSNAMAKRGFPIIAEFPKADTHEKIEEIRPMVRLVIDEFLKGTYAQVMIAYTDFVSALTQKPRIRQLLPIVGEDQYLGSVNRAQKHSLHIQTQDRIQTHSLRHNTQVESARLNASLMRMDAVGEDGYLFEPSPKSVLDALLPRVVEVQLYQAVLESDASEHSARMFAMRNATEAAGEMISELTLLYNQTRQAGITQEIAEISAGRIAIER